jgi:hypothetical protein
MTRMSLEAAEQKQGHMRWSRLELSSDALALIRMQSVLINTMQSFPDMMSICAMLSHLILLLFSNKRAYSC